MKDRLCLFAAVLLGAWGLAGVAPARAAAPPADPGADVQDVVVLGDGGPVLLRLRVRLDGRPFRAAWGAAVRKVFDYLDVNGDGSLDAKEAARAPTTQTLFGGGALNRLERGRAAPAGLDADRDGKVSRRELADYYTRAGAPPFQFQFGGQGGDPRLVRLAATRARTASGPASADALNKRLFALLDANEDGKLSKAELAAAPKALAKLDADDDEMVTVAEVTGASNPSPAEAERLVQLLAAGGMPAPVTSGGPFYVVTSDRPDEELAQRLLGRYAAKGGKSLTLKASGLTKESFGRLDADGDGTLDAGELARFALRPPDLQLAVRLDAKGAAVEAVGKSAAVKAVKGGVELALGNTRVTLAAPAPAAVGPTVVRTNLRAAVEADFKAADRDNNGYLDEKEGRASPPFAGTFTRMDRDSDGKLYLKEVLAYADAMVRLRDAAAGACVSLSVTDQGKGLFDLVDLDGDGRLSVRELRQLGNLVAKLDLDGDRALTLHEVPRSYRASFAKGAASGDPFGQQVVARRLLGEPRAPRPAPAEGPVWFRKMDRNRDGDVSRKEFLGTDEQFRAIDADGDGLISPKEADDHDQKLRKTKEVR